MLITMFKCSYVLGRQIYMSVTFVSESYVLLYIVISMHIYQLIMKRRFNNSDGHQFHQYQQNEQSPLIPTELAEHKKTHDI